MINHAKHVYDKRKRLQLVPNRRSCENSFLIMDFHNLSVAKGMDL